MTTIIKEESESEVSDIEEESEIGEESGDEEDLNIPSLINHFFTNEDGENIAEILTQFKKSLDTHNKILYKLLSSAENKNK